MRTPFVLPLGQGLRWFVVSFLVITALVMPLGAGAQSNPQITALTVDPAFDPCNLGDDGVVSGTVASEGLADTTAVVITISYMLNGFVVEWGQGTSNAAVPPDPVYFGSTQLISANGAWTIGRNALDARTDEGSDFVATADTLVIQADLYDSEAGRIAKVSETGALIPWQVIYFDLTACVDAPPSRDPGNTVGPPDNVDLPDEAQVPANPGPPEGLELPENAGPPEDRGKPANPGKSENPGKKK